MVRHSSNRNNGGSRVFAAGTMSTTYTLKFTYLFWALVRVYTNNAMPPAAPCLPVPVYLLLITVVIGDLSHQDSLPFSPPFFPFLFLLPFPESWRRRGGSWRILSPQRCPHPPVRRLLLGPSAGKVAPVLCMNKSECGWMVMCGGMCVNANIHERKYDGLEISL